MVLLLLCELLAATARAMQQRCALLHDGERSHGTHSFEKAMQAQLQGEEMCIVRQAGERRPGFL